MKRIKNLFLFATTSLLFFSFSNCGSSQTTSYTLTQNPPFAIEDVFYQNWVAGIQEGGSGTDVHVTVKDVAGNVVIDSIYFRNKTTKAKKSPQANTQYTGNFKNETNRDVIMDGNSKKEAKNTPPQPFPFKLAENEAVVSYSQNGTIKYYKITNIREKQMLAYPAGPPEGDN